MKKQFVVINVETVAWDDQIITLKSADATMKIHLHDQLEHNQFSIGDEVEIELPIAVVKKQKVKKEKTVA